MGAGQFFYVGYFLMVRCDEGFAGRYFLGGDVWVTHLFGLLPDGAGGGGAVWSCASGGSSGRLPDFLPAVSMLKPLHGTEPGMERNIASFFEQEYPGEWELLFCARHESDEGLQLARAVGQRYPQVDTRYVTCGEPTPKFHNAKVYSLAKMDSVAKNDLYVTSDADVRVEKDYLLRMVQYLKDPQLGLPAVFIWGRLSRIRGMAGRGSRRSWMRWERAWR